MGIKLEHKLSAVGGLAAFAAGREKARQRTQKQLLDVQRDQMRIQAQQQGQFQGGSYRRYLTDRRRTGTGASAQSQRATIDDPFANAMTAGDNAKAVQISTQRKANARAIRMGQPPPYPKAESRPVPPPTAAAQQREFSRKQAEIGRDFQREQAEGKSRIAGEQEDLDFLQMRDAEGKKRAEAIRKAIGGTSDDPEMRKAIEAMDQAVTILEGDKNGDGRLTAAERYKVRIERRQKVIDLYDPGIHDADDSSVEGNWNMHTLDDGTRVKDSPVDLEKAFNESQFPIPGRKGIWQHERDSSNNPTGNFEQVEEKEAEAAETPVERTARLTGVLTARQKLTDALMGNEEDPESERGKEVSGIVDSILPDPFAGGKLGADKAASGAAGTRKVTIGRGGTEMAAPQEPAKAPEADPAKVPEADPFGVRAWRRRRELAKVEAKITARNEAEFGAPGVAGVPGQAEAEPEPEPATPDRPQGTPPPRPGRPGYEAWMERVAADEAEQQGQAKKKISPDGKWEWNGTEWVERGAG